MGELEVRGPWVAGGYHGGEGTEKFTDDGWFATGDVVTIDPRGCIKICDRSKDLVKSGGEWISSVDMENLLMAHPAVAEAAVIAVPDERWGERPLGVIALAEGAEASPDELREHLSSDFAKWQLPGALRVRRRDPADGDRQVEEDRAAGSVRRQELKSGGSGAQRITAVARAPEFGAAGSGDCMPIAKSRVGPPRRATVTDTPSRP